ncbi:MAG: hypothetical protein ABEI11_00205 [Haloarculaceae archaeon]
MSGVTDDGDPTAIRALVVNAEDVVAALEANERRDAGAVLRVTPPFAARMRARLHVAGGEGEYDEPKPVHVSPDRLVADPPPFPTPDGTADELRGSEEPYTRERHRARHEERVASWRAAARERIVTEATIDTPAGDHEVAVKTLG